MFFSGLRNRLRGEWLALRCCRWPGFIGGICSLLPGLLVVAAALSELCAFCPVRPILFQIPILFAAGWLVFLFAEGALFSMIAFGCLPMPKQLRLRCAVLWALVPIFASWWLLATVVRLRWILGTIILLLSLAACFWRAFLIRRLWLLPALLTCLSVVWLTVCLLSGIILAILC